MLLWWNPDRLTSCPLQPCLTAGLKATRGDDVYHEDETTAALEDRIARMTGKEAAMFCVSGTMTNRALGVGERVDA